MTTIYIYIYVYIYIYIHVYARVRTTRSLSIRVRFIVRSNNRFNNLHFIISLKPNTITTCFK